MTKYHLGSDKGGSSDEQCLEEIKSALEAAKHDVNYLRIDPNLESDLSSNCKEGEIGLFGVNGFCIGTLVSVNSMASSKNIQVIFFTMASSSSQYCVEPGYSSKKVDMAHDDNFSSAETRSKYGGKKYTPKEIVDQLSNVSFVPWQGSCSAQAQGILNGATGSSTDSSSGDDSIMSGWDSLCDLMKPLDGLAMMVQRGDTVIVKRITVPEEKMGDASIVTTELEEDTADNTLSNQENEYDTTYVTVGGESSSKGIDNPTVDDDVKLFAYEGINIVEDSVKITEYNPEIYNTLEIYWGESYENSFVLTFNKHKDIFGERLKEMYACNKETVDSSEETTTTSSSETTTTDSSGSTTT